MNEQKISNELKILALEAINNAGSGHSGAVLSCGDILYTLYTRHLLSNPERSMLRDRFVLSNGHACASLYAILSALGYFDTELLHTFRKFGGYLSGHPEIHIPGIDSATGPLGQGVANAVGMAIAETMMDSRFGAGHYTYCMAGDGCLQEGVALEALSIAGLYHLNKFILLYDKNNVTLDGVLTNSSIDNIAKKFKAINFNVIECDGHKISHIDQAINLAKKSKDKPTIIIFNTIIGKDTSLAGSNKSHGAVYSVEEINDLRKKLNVTSPTLALSDETRHFMVMKQVAMSEKLAKREQQFNDAMHDNQPLLKKYNQFINNDFSYNIKTTNDAMSTRDANNLVLNQICETQENIIVLSADLSSSTRVKINLGGEYNISNRQGRNVAVGIREHAMGAIANGIALHGGLRVICTTFMTFSNYLIPPIRMAAIMKLPVMYAFSHASGYDSPDGITHLPIEQLDQLRLIPNLVLARPDDIEECVQCYDWWKNLNGPMCLALSKTKLPYIGKFEDVSKGAYYIQKNRPKINIIASGGEVEIALETAKLLKDEFEVGVVSMLSLEMFEKQPSTYRKTLFNRPTFVIESSTCAKYYKYVAENHIFNTTDFGKSGDDKSLKLFYGLDAEVISKKIKKVLEKEAK